MAAEGTDFMESLLQKLYDGRVHPAENIGQKNQELRQISREISGAETRLLECLSDNQKELLRQLKILKSKYDDVFIYESFAHGYKLGISLLVEGLNNTGSLARNDE